MPDITRPTEAGSAEDRVPANLPAVPDGGAVDGVVFEGGPAGQARTPLPAVPASRAVVLSPRAVALLRHAAYVPAGAIVIARRWHHHRTRHHRMMNAAEAAGDHEAVLKWAQHHALAAHQRHERFTGKVEAFVALVKVAPWLLAGWLIAMGMLGVFLALARKDWHLIGWPWLAMAHVVSVGVQVGTALALIAVVAVPVVLVAVLYYHGRAGSGFTPAWVVTAQPEDEDTGIVITADTIVLALQNVPIGPLKAAFKQGWRPAFHTLPVKDGQGYTAVFSVPLGVTAEMIADQVEVFARNLHRAKTEVWPTDAERGKIAPAGFVSMWVANPGVLDKPAPEYPLLHDGTADVFAGVPAGVSPRGDAIAIPVVANNFVAGGMMGQGKSNACRVLMLGAALDPIAELWVHVFAYNGDFDAFRPRLARYVKGAEAEQITAAMDSLHEMYAEVGRREARLAELGALKVTRNLALRHPDMRPRLTLFSECHELFGNREFGTEAAELAAAVIRRARKTALWMGFDTQDARKDAIPPKIVSLVSVNACFAVKTWRANDGFLGDGSFAAGIRATELRPGRDTGRSLITGVSDAQFELVKWHYIRSDDERGTDDAAPVIARAMGNLAPGMAVEATSPVAAIEWRDLLQDLAAVTKDDTGPVRIADLPPRLRVLADTWGPYRALTGVQLRQQLDDEGVKWTNTNNVPRLDPAALRDRIAERGE